MSYALRRAVPDDAALLAEHRACVWREVGNWDDDVLAGHTVIWTAWMRGAVADGTYIAFVAEKGGETLGSCGLLVHVAIPRPNSPSDRAGRVHSMYVRPGARRRGVARALMHEIVAYGRDAAMVFLSLGPSPQAHALYASLGFEDRPEMRMLLHAES